MSESLVTVEKLVQGGRGLAHVDGQVLCVRGAIPVEAVSVAHGEERYERIGELDLLAES